MKYVLKFFKYIFLSYGILILSAAFLGKEKTNEYYGGNLLEEYLILGCILILIDLIIWLIKRYK